MNVPTRTELDHARIRFDMDWGRVDEVLYDICSAHPDHSTRRDVMAKVALIGRTYSSGIERCFKKASTQAIIVVGNYVHEHRLEVDKIVTAIRNVKEPLSADAMGSVVQQHGRFTALLKCKECCSKSPRSFAAKYLHFHQPAVPIYDSNAARHLRGMVRWPGSAAEIGWQPDGDKEYWEYCVRLLRLYSACRQSGVKASVKELDIYLGSWADADGA